VGGLSALRPVIHRFFHVPVENSAEEADR
jgi:hypothetical protein